MDLSSFEMRFQGRNKPAVLKSILKDGLFPRFENGYLDHDGLS